MTIRDLIEIALAEYAVEIVKGKDPQQERLRIIEEVMQKINKLVGE